MKTVEKKRLDSTLGNDALKLTISKFIALAISFISVMLLSRFLTLEEYGTYSQLLLVINLFTALFMLGLPNSINYFLARAETEGERKEFLSVYYSFSTILSFLVGIILMLAVNIITDYFNNSLLKSFLYVLAIYPWSKIIMSGIENVLIVYKRASLIIYYRVTHSIFLLLIIVFVQIMDMSFNWYMSLFIIIESAFTFIVYLIVNKLAGKLNISFNFKAVKEILFFSVPIGLATAVGTLNIALDKLMIGKFLDTEHLAIYTNASRELPFTIIATSLTAVLLPQLVRSLKKNETHKAVNIWGHTTTLSYIIICFAVTFIFIFAAEVMTILYSEKFLPGITVFKIYCLTLLLKSTYFGIILNATGKTKFILYSSIASLFLNVILNYILFHIIGFEGPAVATFLSQLIINLIQLVFTAKILKISFLKVFPWKILGKITMINITLGFLFTNIKSFVFFEVLMGEILESILLTVLAGVLYLLIFSKEIKRQWSAINKV